MGIRNYFLQRQAEMDSKINNQTMGGVSRNTSRVLNPPGGRSNMSDIFGGGEVGAQQNQKPVEKQVKFSEDNKTETKDVKNCETQTDAGQNSRNDAAKYKQRNTESQISW